MLSHDLMTRDLLIAEKKEIGALYRDILSAFTLAELESFIAGCDAPIPPAISEAIGAAVARIQTRERQRLAVIEARTRLRVVERYKAAARHRAALRAAAMDRAEQLRRDRRSRERVEAILIALLLIAVGADPRGAALPAILALCSISAEAAAPAVALAQAISLPIEIISDRFAAFLAAMEAPRPPVAPIKLHAPPAQPIPAWVSPRAALTAADEDDKPGGPK